MSLIRFLQKSIQCRFLMTDQFQSSLYFCEVYTSEFSIIWTLSQKFSSIFYFL